jgi:DNA-binding beta-propeller fold protein YncE
LKRISLLLLVTCLTSVVAASPVGVLTLVDTIEVGGAARWDYLTVDSVGHRLYLSHGTQTEVVDLQTDRKIHAIANTPGVHGIAIARDLGVGFISNGKGDSVTVFDLDSLETTATIKVGGNPDAIVYEPKSQRVVTFNGRSHDATIIDAKRREVTATVPVKGKPEYAQSNDSGTVYFNIEDTNELAVLDPVSAKLLHRYSLSPCDGPSGLVIDPSQRVYSVCENKMMIVSAADGTRLAQVPIGVGADGVAWLDGAAYSANGSDGTITVVDTSGPRIEAVAMIPSAVGARTIAADAATGRLYLPTAAFQPSTTGGRRVGVDGTLHILVFARKVDAPVSKP